ncbi:MAG: hypothetical protein H0T46_24060 [Deltaproteobacteria bacterium]|nr:hypothetical protein [Deltaproteobacteria bacterium]
MSIPMFLAGSIAMAAFVTGIIFLKYWRLSRDPFFIWFAAAFWTFTVGWILKLVGPDYQEHTHYLYLPRLLGFLMILIAIVMKNRRRPE